MPHGKNIRHHEVQRHLWQSVEFNTSFGFLPMAGFLEGKKLIICTYTKLVNGQVLQPKLGEKILFSMQNKVANPTLGVHYVTRICLD